MTARDLREKLRPHCDGPHPKQIFLDIFEWFFKTYPSDDADEKHYIFHETIRRVLLAKKGYERSLADVGQYLNSYCETDVVDRTDPKTKRGVDH